MILQVLLLLWPFLDHICWYAASILIPNPFCEVLPVSTTLQPLLRFLHMFLPCQAFVGAGDGGSCRACLERLRYMTFASCAHGCEKCLAQLACQVRWCELSDPFGGKAGSLWAELLQLIISRWIYRNEQKSPKDWQNDLNMLEITWINIQIWQKTGMWERNDSLKKMGSASFWSSSRGCELLKSERLAGGQIVSNSP